MKKLIALLLIMVMVIAATACQAKAWQQTLSPNT